MMNWLYEWLSRIGYHHPLHPPVTHIPVGLVIGAVVFGLAAWILRRESLAQTAQHCIILALMAAPVAVLLGLMDWQRFYGGAWLLPIWIKMVLAVVLIILLVMAWRASQKKGIAFHRTIGVYALCLMTVTALGFFGGELVYGTKKITSASETPLVRHGAELFEQSCSLCHYTDTTKTKIGPGLKGLFQHAQLPASKRPVSADSIADLLKTPLDEMPPFPDLTDEQVESLVAYLKTI